MKAAPWVLAVVGWLVAAFFIVDHVKASARADAARRTYEASTAAYVQTIAEAEARISERGVRIQALEAERAAALAEADAVADTRPPEPPVAPYLPDSVAGMWEAWRSSVMAELAAVRHALDLADQQIAALNATLADRDAQLAATRARLATALEGWEAAERARRPTLTTWVTRGLAIVGGVVLVRQAIRWAQP